MAKPVSTQAPTLLSGFSPVSALWQGDNALYPSEQSALWALRQLRGVLAEAGGLALHRGRTLIDLEKMILVVEQHAIEKAKARYCRVAGQAETAPPSPSGLISSAELRDLDSRA